MNAAGQEPIVIVGSRLQSLIYGVSAVGLAIAFFETLGWPILVLSAALVILSLVVLARRAVLADDGLELRGITGTRTVPMGAFTAETGHRYLTITFLDGSISRIEVPVEVRPNVREWAARQTEHHE